MALATGNIAGTAPTVPRQPGALSRRMTRARKKGETLDELAELLGYVKGWAQHQFMPDLAPRLLTMLRCAYGLDAMLPLLRVADLRHEQFEAGNDLEILRGYTMGGLHYAAEVLADPMMRRIDALSSMEVRHG